MKDFKVGTFNLRNLVLPNHRYYGNEQYSDEKYQKQKAESKAGSPYVTYTFSVR